MKVTIYAKKTVLDDSDPIQTCERWCKRRRIAVNARITEYSEAQKKLKRLIQNARTDDFVIFPSAFHTAPAITIISTLRKLIEKGCRVVFVREGIDLKPSSPSTRRLLQLAAMLTTVEADFRSYRRRRALMFARIMGVPIGAKKTPVELRTQAAELLQQGWSVRRVARQLHVSKSFVSLIRQTTFKRG